MRALAQVQRRWIALLAGAAAIIAFPHFAPLMSFRPIQLQENRLLAQWPSAPRSLAEAHSYPARINAFLTDNFPLRTQIIGFSNLVRYHLGYSAHKSVLVGRNGWLFYNDGSYLAHGRGLTRVDKDGVEAWLSGLRQRLELGKRNGFRLYILAAPVKESVYPEEMPQALTTVDVTEVNQLARAAEGIGFRGFVDPHNSLLAAKTDEAVYEAFDTHWTADGAYVAYQQFIRTMSADFTDMTALPKHAFRYNPRVVHRDLARMLGIADFVPHTRRTFIETPYHETSRVTYLTPRRHFNAPQVIETGASGGRTLLFIRDSFGAELLQLLKPHFARIIMTHGPNDGAFPLALIERYKPDVVLLEIVGPGLRFMLGPL